MRMMLRIATVLALAASPALADGEMKGEDLAAAISGKTIQGNMKTSGDYTEYYAPDGTLKGKDYTGKWRVNDQNQICISYGTEATENCWHGKVQDNNVTWMRDGREDGGGSISAGDVGGFRDSDRGRR